MARSTPLTSPSTPKQPLAQRSENIPSPINSPSKVALPPSPAPSPTKMTTKQAMITTTKRNASASHLRNSSQDMMEPVIQNPMSTSNIEQKPDMVRKIAEAHLTGQTYVSPSDDIFSPTTMKLNEVKAKRFGNFKKKSSLYNSQSLFSRALTKEQHGDRSS